jgi:hypothetical protein
MSRITAGIVIGILVGLLLGGGMMRIDLFSFFKPNMVVVDVFGLVERQRLLALKEAKNPDAIDETVRNRLVRLANLLAQIGEKQVVLNKAAVVAGTLPDVTAEVEEALAQGKGGPR